MPIIPICGAAAPFLKNPLPKQITNDALKSILDGVFARLDAVIRRVIGPHLPWYLPTGLVSGKITGALRDGSEASIRKDLAASRCLK